VSVETFDLDSKKSDEEEPVNVNNPKKNDPVLNRAAPANYATPCHMGSLTAKLDSSKVINVFETIGKVRNESKLSHSNDDIREKNISLK
jgi:hypothetical protein